MKKRILSLALALIMVLTLVAGAIPAMAESEGITIRLHYHREDGKYKDFEAADGTLNDWQLWFWDNTSPAPVTELEPPYELVEENGEMVATIVVKPGTMSVGYIVRLGEWKAKDIEEDQFIDIAGILGGTLDFYVEAGVKGGTLVEGADVKKGKVVTGARYAVNSDGVPQVIVTLSQALDSYDDTTFTLKNADGPVAVTAIKQVLSYYYLTLAEPLDLSRGYEVTFEGNDYTVSMPDYYSSEEFESLYTYTGDDLGATYSASETKLRVWAPTAVSVQVNLYTNGDPAQQATPDKQVDMTKDVNGTWVATLEGDMNGTYYTYYVTTDTGAKEAVDPYARTTGVNGKRGMIIDLASTNPEGWDTDKDPHYDDNFTDAVIYELHVRDLSSDSSSGITHTGKYLGLIETGTKNASGQATGLDHIKDLGITHIHLLPVYDYGSVDETKLDKAQFNWGYDPVNYNVPEGSYSTDPYNGEVRVKEFKQMVKGLHDNGISVIMDVVYNHVQDANKFCVNQIVNGYFTRPGSNGSGCGNDVASERAMVSKYIVDSVKYWADEYHIDGFRFDLVGLLDTATINAIVETVHETHPNVVFYGEGWTMSTKPTKDGIFMATQINSKMTPNFAYFSDTIRNDLKGGTYGGVSTGYISGASGKEGSLKACFKGMPSWCTNPSQSVNYISCHDNNTLFDHITMVATGASMAERVSMNKLGAAFYMTAQGIPFFQAGEEILRSKPTENGSFNENSYNASDAVNSIKWDTLNDETYQDVYEYYKGLIAFRKAHPALRLTTADEVDANVAAVDGTDAGVMAFTINGGVNGETAEALYAVFNANKAAATVTLPAGNWNVYINGEDAGTEVLASVEGTLTVPACSAMVLVKEDAPSTQPGTDPSEGTEATEPSATQPTETQPSGTTEQPAAPDNTLVIVLGVVAVIAIAVVAFVLIKKRQQ